MAEIKKTKDYAIVTTITAAEESQLLKEVADNKLTFTTKVTTSTIMLFGSYTDEEKALLEMLPFVKNIYDTGTVTACEKFQ